MFWKKNKEIEKKVKEFEQKLLREEKMKQRLLSKEFDYQYLQELINQCENNRDLVMEIDTADHVHIVIKTQKQAPRQAQAAIFDREDI